MMVSRRLLLALVIPAFTFVLVATSLYFGSDHIARVGRLSFFHGAPDPASSAAATAFPEPPTHVFSAEGVQAYIDAILDPSATHLPRLECHDLDRPRYKALLMPNATVATRPPIVEFFFAIDLRNVVELLPRLLGSVVEVVRFLGPARCAVSVVEGNSPDGTAEILAGLRGALADEGIAYTYQYSDINPNEGEGDRIQGLAALRNMALEPLLSQYVSDPSSISQDAAVVFLNDVAACPEDILELALQRKLLGADMTCPMDWTYAGDDPSFYDVWIARDVKNGDSFFHIPANGSWDGAWDLFPNDTASRGRLDAHLPFQVFSCWNGAAVFAALPGLLEDNIRFRAPNGRECGQGEPQLFCKDLWFHGHGKIAVVPSVNLDYSNENGRKIKAAKGYTSDNVKGKSAEESRIDWQAEPPENVLCMEGWHNQFFQAWNYSLELNV